MRIAILTDSSYDGRIEEYKDLHLVPLIINTEDGREILDDNNLAKDEFYELLDNQLLKTSQATPGQLMKVWDELLVNYEQIIYLPISKGLSGQFANARMLSEIEEAYKGKVFVCDGNNVSIITQKTVKQIAFWIAENKTGFEILELVNEYNSNFTTFIIPKNLETLKRGGRITPTAAALAKMLKIIPILRYDGTIDKEDTARTFKRAIKEALKMIKKECHGVKVIDVAYSRFDSEDFEMILKIIADEGFKIDTMSELTNVIIAHTGRETIALCGWKKPIK